MTNLTAVIIATRDDIVIDAGGPTVQGKYTGWITLGVEDRYRPLFHSDPIYDSKDDAKAAMQQVVDEVRRESLERNTYCI